MQVQGHGERGPQCEQSSHEGAEPRLSQQRHRKRSTGHWPVGSELLRYTEGSVAHAGRSLSEVVGGTGALHRMVFAGLMVAPGATQAQGRALGLLISSGVFGAEGAMCCGNVAPGMAWDGLGWSLSLGWLTRCPGLGLGHPHRASSHVILHLALAFCLRPSV